MEGCPISWQKTVWQTKSMLSQIAGVITKVSKISDRDISCLRSLNCPVNYVKKRKVQLISWKKPAGQQLKLNVDGSSIGNPGSAGGGGILRDSKGRCWAGFSRHYGNCTNMAAETRALLDGLRMCRDLGIRDIIVETDSNIVVQWLHKDTCSLWWLWEFWEEILELTRLLNAQVQHVFREANMAADLLAKNGSSGVSFDLSFGDKVPALLKGILHTDSLEIPYLRD
jgi:ribonuclease HI